MPSPNKCRRRRSIGFATFLRRWRWQWPSRGRRRWCMRGEEPLSTDANTANLDDIGHSGCGDGEQGARNRGPGGRRWVGRGRVGRGIVGCNRVGWASRAWWLGKRGDRKPPCKSRREGAWERAGSSHSNGPSNTEGAQWKKSTKVYGGASTTLIGGLLKYVR
jgi:hypothetical protein